MNKLIIPIIAVLVVAVGIGVFFVLQKPVPDTPIPATSCPQITPPSPQMEEECKKEAGKLEPKKNEQGCIIGYECKKVVACIENWQCSDWSTCQAGKQTRTCTDGNSCEATANKPTESQNCEEVTGEISSQYGIYTFYEGSGDLRDYTFLDGYVMRKRGAGSWKDIEKSEGVYDFSGMDAVIKEIAPTGKKISFLITNAASREPEYIASHSGVTTYSYTDIKTGESVTRAVPWDAYQLERFEAFVKALANHEINGVAFKNHPTVANIALGIPGINQGYRSREVQFKDMPGYDREKFRDAIIKSLHIAVDNMPGKNHYLGAWKEKDDIASPELGDYLAQEIISEFGSKIMFWNENLAAKIVSGVVSGSPKCDFASPLCNSKDKTPIGFQMLQGWSCPFANPNATTGGATPSDGIQYAYDTFNARYFEVYMCDLDNSAYWAGLQEWHDKLESESKK